MEVVPWSNPDNLPVCLSCGRLMAYIRTIRRWIGDDINIFRCAQCGTFVTRPAKAVIRDARKNSN
jgi:predicted RNA-binding Zn-ribbon protein involved in translation (DUF1610 family)